MEEEFKINKLIHDISNYNNGKYIEVFYKDIQTFHKGYKLPILNAISDMSINIGIKEYYNFQNNIAYMTKSPKEFIQFAYNKDAFNGFFEKIKIKKNLLGFNNEIKVDKLPNKILEDFLKYEPPKKIPTMFDVLEGKQLESFQ